MLWAARRYADLFCYRAKGRSSRLDIIANINARVNLAFYLAGVAGLEPTTPGFGDQCSSQLSYTPIAIGIVPTSDRYARCVKAWYNYRHETTPCIYAALFDCDGTPGKWQNTFARAFADAFSAPFLDTPAIRSFVRMVIRPMI